MNGVQCLSGVAGVVTSGGVHAPRSGTVKDYSDDSQSAECSLCGHQIRRFYVDDDDDRHGGWSAWAAPRYVIEELELP